MNALSREKKSWRRYVAYLVLAAIVVFLPFILTSLDQKYLIMISNFSLIYIVAVSGLDILFGYCGQISLGHAAFYAIGAYGSGILSRYLGVPALLAIVLGALFAAGVGALLALPASKLKFHFLSLATVAFGEIIYQLITHSPGGVTGDFTGLFVQRLKLFGVKIGADNTNFFYFALVIVVIFMVLKSLLVKSRTGRAFIAIRENVQAAEGMGIDVRRYKVIAFATSAFTTAFAGGLYIFYVGYASPGTFMQKQSVSFLTMMLFGGSGSLAGPIVGAVSIEALIELTRFLEDYQVLMYGVIILLVVLAIPGGLVGLWHSVMDRIKAKKAMAADEASAKGGKM